MQAGNESLTARFLRAATQTAEAVMDFYRGEPSDSPLEQAFRKGVTLGAAVGLGTAVTFGLGWVIPAALGSGTAAGVAAHSCHRPT